VSSSASERLYRRQNSVLALLAGLVVAIISIAAIQQDRLRAHVTTLADPALAGRRSGQPGALKAADYIFNQFREIGFDVRRQEFSDNRTNVVARLGSADRHIVIGAHYDGQPGFPSASDNAAGVAMLLELARELKTVSLPVSLVLIAFDDEEQGLNGSQYYVSNPIFPLEQIMSVVVFDTVGRSFIDLKETTLFALGTEYSADLATVVGRQKRTGMLVAGTDLIGPRSDFAPFAARRIPYLFFSHGTHKDYHGPGDRAELLNYPKLTQDTTLIRQVIVDIANLKTKPAFRAEPVYPASEIDTLARIITMIRAEKKDLAPAYQMVFDDMEKRIRTTKSREPLMVAASAMLGLATPRLSPFMLDLIVAPYYEKDKKPEVVKALVQESARWRN
jgi:hypothetical protein